MTPGRPQGDESDSAVSDSSAPPAVGAAGAGDVADESQVLALLHALHAGEPGAHDRLAERIFEDLRRMARRRLGGRARGGLTIQPTMLATDTLMKLIQQRQRFDSAGHLFAIASRMMMRLLIDYHRGRNAQRRGGGETPAARVPLDNEIPAEQHESDVDAEALDGAMQKLAALDPRKADVVRYRVLWALTMPQVAEALGISVATAERDWSFARTWLARELAGSAPRGGGGGGDPETGKK